MNKRAAVFSLSVSVALLVISLSAIAETMEEEIDYLLTTVGESNCTFIRNGRSYAAQDARKHLDTKRKRGKRYFSSADEYIERLASRSSMSGDPYFIQCADDVRQPSGEWFAALLAKYRKRKNN